MNRSHYFNLIAGIVLAVSTTTGVAGNGKLGKKANAQANRPEMVDVIVTYKALPDQAEADRAKGLGAHTYRRYGHLPMRAMRIPGHALEALANGDGVKFVSVDAEVEAFSQSARETAKLPVPGSPNFITVDPNLAVAVLDSGVSQHADLAVTNRVDCTVPVAGGNDTVRDQFSTASYSNNDGSANWSGAWVEYSDNGLASSGNIRIDGASLHLDNLDGGSKESIQRAADLSAASVATLSLDYAGYGTGGLDIVTFEVSSDGGASYTTLESMEVVGTVNGTRSYNLSDYVALNAQTTVRIRLVQGFGASGQDRLQVRSRL